MLKSGVRTTAAGAMHTVGTRRRSPVLTTATMLAIDSYTFPRSSIGLSSALLRRRLLVRIQSREQYQGEGTVTETVDVDNIVTDNEVFMTQVLDLFSRLGLYDMLFWRKENGHIRFFVICNDTFFWATADVEEVTQDNVKDLEQAVADVQAVDPDADERMGPLLFCARQRGVRPMPRMEVPKALRPLFDACGPERTSNDFLE